MLIEVSPNPANTSITANIFMPAPCGPEENSSSSYRIEIHNLNGNTLYSGDFETSEFGLDVSYLNPGYYIMSAIATNGETAHVTLTVE